MAAYRERTKSDSFAAWRVAIGATVFVAACAGNPAPGPPAPPATPPDPALAQQAVTNNALRSALQITFDFELQERDGRFSGNGVTRAEPPDRARLDLFGPRGEEYLKAALIGLQMNLPDKARQVPLPPPALLWSVLGVFTPPGGTTLHATTQTGETLWLEYAGNNELWRFRFDNGKLRQAEWTGESSGRRTVVLSGTGQQGLPTEAVYRDIREFVELRVKVQQIQTVNGFPPDIWSVRQN